MPYSAIGLWIKIYWVSVCTNKVASWEPKGHFMIVLLKWVSQGLCCILLSLKYDSDLGNRKT